MRSPAPGAFVYLMHTSKLLLIPAAVAALVLAGCGGGSQSVPADAVAVVDGTEIPKAQFDQIMAQARKSYEQQEREWPKAGTAEFQTLRGQAVQFLVQRAQFENEAEDLGVEVTDKQVDDRLKQIKQQYFGGDQKKYEAQLKEQGLNETQVRADIRSQLVSEAIFKEVTGDVKVTDKEIEDYYAKNKEQYSQPESRDVRHILVKTKAQADRLYGELQDGADFAALAKEHSEDPGSKEQGGKLTISRGQTVAPFDKAAFELAKNKVSQPVKTEYGFHIIEPLSEIKPAKQTPLKDVKESIRQQLLQQKRNQAMTDWVESVREEYCDGKLSYQTGFKPSPDPCADDDEKGTTAEAE